MLFTKCLILLLFSLINVNGNYWSKRKILIEKEKRMAIGGNITLQPSEVTINNFLLKLKQEDYANFNDSAFLPAKSFLTTKKLIEDSKLFEFIVRFPKGSSLHTHILAAVSFDYLFNNLTHRPHLYACNLSGQLKLQFHPQEGENNTCKWDLVSDLRKNNATYDKWLRSQLFLNKQHSKKAAWDKFASIFRAVYGLLTYRPIFEEYLYQSLKELYEDTVIYAEFRGTFMNLYEANGTVLHSSQFLDVLNYTIERFKSDHPKFIGAKYIYSPHRKLDVKMFKEYRNMLHESKLMHPNLIAGFDFVGFEDDGHPLRHYVDELSGIHKSIPFLFHAGETNWYGTDADLNIIDAVLLGSTRIGHGYSLIKHPEVLRLIKEKNVCLEVSPISNQVLKFVEDLRNHPASMLIAHGYPIVICNDDPTFWGAKGLSYDWYLVFIAMAHKDSGLEFLKEVALNSIWYSNMDKYEKDRAFKVFEKQWSEYLELFLQFFKFLMFHG